MPAECPACGSQAPHHFILEAQCLARWRGKSFDADAALGNIGLALADTLGVSPRDFDRFQQLVRLEAFREDQPDNPPEKFDPGEGERWEFHVSILTPLDADKRKRAEQSAQAALEGSRNFESARIRAKNPPDPDFVP